MPTTCLDDVAACPNQVIVIWKW